jgi:hypothetical protein
LLLRQARLFEQTPNQSNWATASFRLNTGCSILIRILFPRLAVHEMRDMEIIARSSFER